MDSVAAQSGDNEDRCAAGALPLADGLEDGLAARTHAGGGGRGELGGHSVARRGCAVAPLASLLGS